MYSLRTKPQWCRTLYVNSGATHIVEAEVNYSPMSRGQRVSHEPVEVQRPPSKTGLGVNRWSLRNNWLKFETSGGLAIVLEESIEGIYLKWNKATPEPAGFRISQILADYVCIYIYIHPKTSWALLWNITDYFRGIYRIPLHLLLKEP